MTGWLLDTNIVSSFRAPTQNLPVIRWLEARTPSDLYIAAPTLGEVRFGIEILPLGKRKTALENWFNKTLLPDFAGRILAFDRPAALLWGSMAAHNKKQGTPRPTMDSLLAAIAHTNRMTLVTRNTKDFTGCGVKLLNPFEE